MIKRLTLILTAACMLASPKANAQSSAPVLPIPQYAPVRIQYPLISPFLWLGITRQPQVNPLRYSPVPPTLYNLDKSDGGWAFLRYDSYWVLTWNLIDRTSGHVTSWIKTTMHYDYRLGYRKTIQLSQGGGTDTGWGWNNSDNTMPIEIVGEWNYATFGTGTAGGSNFSRNDNTAYARFALAPANLASSESREILLRWSAYTWPYQTEPPVWMSSSVIQKIALAQPPYPCLIDAWFPPNWQHIGAEITSEPLVLN